MRAHFETYAKLLATTNNICFTTFPLWSCRTAEGSTMALANYSKNGISFRIPFFLQFANFTFPFNAFNYSYLSRRTSYTKSTFVSINEDGRARGKVKLENKVLVGRSGLSDRLKLENWSFPPPKTLFFNCILCWASSTFLSTPIRVL